MLNVSLRENTPLPVYDAESFQPSASDPVIEQIH